jgi:hypothetical protein
MKSYLNLAAPEFLGATALFIVSEWLAYSKKEYA